MNIKLLESFSSLFGEEDGQVDAFFEDLIETTAEEFTISERISIAENLLLLSKESSKKQIEVLDEIGWVWQPDEPSDNSEFLAALSNVVLVSVEESIEN